LTVTPSLSVFSNLRAAHDVSSCCFTLVAFARPRAGGAGVFEADLVAVGPAVVLVGPILLQWAVVVIPLFLPVAISLLSG
jgi:hypothetical protein